MLKLKSKHLIFEASVARIKTYLLVDNGSKVELINESFVHTNKINTFKLKQRIRLELENREMVEWLD